MNIKAAIFDFDGTLFDSMHIWDKAASQFLILHGITPEADTDAKFKSLSLREACELFRRQYDFQASVDELIDSVNSTIEHMYAEVEPKRGAIDFLHLLHERGISVAVATATDRYLIESTLRRFGLENVIDAVFTCNEVGVGKQSPKIYDTACVYFGADKSNSVIFEDALYAVRTAKKFGYTVVGIADPTERDPEAMRELCDYYLDSFENAEEVLNV